jgi:hypothetical protein
MKNLNRILLLCLTTLILQPLTAWSEIAVKDPMSRHKNLFVVRTDKKFLGARVEVLYSNGELVTSQTLQKRKMIIDFCDVKHGSYTIRLLKGQEVREFSYEKK